MTYQINRRIDPGADVSNFSRGAVVNATLDGNPDHCSADTLWFAPTESTGGLIAAVDNGATTQAAGHTLA